MVSRFKPLLYSLIVLFGVIIYNGAKHTTVGLLLEVCGCVCNGGEGITLSKPVYIHAQEKSASLHHVYTFCKYVVNFLGGK